MLNLVCRYAVALTVAGLMMGCSRISQGITASTKPSPHASSVDSAAKSYVAKLQSSKAGYGVVIGEPTPVKATGGVDAS